MKKITVTERFKDGTLVERIAVTEETEDIPCESAKHPYEYESNHLTIACSDYAETGVTTAR